MENFVLFVGERERGSWFKIVVLKVTLKKWIGKHSNISIMQIIKKQNEKNKANSTL